MLAMASNNVLVGRRCMIPRAHYPNLTPPDPSGWPARVTEYHSGGSQSRGGRGRRWGVLADDDVGKGRGWVASATLLLSLEELREWTILDEGEAREDIQGDRRARRSAAVVVAPRVVASIDRATKMLQNEPKGGCNARKFAATTTRSSPEPSRATGSQPMMRWRGAAWAAASPPQGPKTAEKRPFSDSEWFPSLKKFTDTNKKTLLSP